MTSQVAILGAGPAGLTLASLLQKNSISCTIFDLRSRPSANTTNVPSGSLDLHAESGILALEACGLSSKFKALTSECSEEMILADKNGVVRYQDDGQGGERPEISRNSLTDLLLSSVREESIRWEHKLLSISRAAHGKWELSFASLSEPLVFDLVIGADGAWSKIRSVFTAVEPFFSGVNCITLTIPHITTTHPSLAALVGGGSYYAGGDKKAIMSQRGSSDSARLYLMISSSSDTWLRDRGIIEPTMTTITPAALKHTLLTDPALFSTWAPPLQHLIATACDCETAANAAVVDAKPLYMLPTSHAWEHVAGVTLIGDAAHLMTPFAGEGVNAAMQDALELAGELARALKAPSGMDDELDNAVRIYERNMFVRARAIMEETWSNLELIFADDAPDGFVKMMESHGPPPPPPPLPLPPLPVEEEE